MIPLNLLFYIFLSILVVSLISLIGVFALSISTKTLNKLLVYLVSFSAGALFGDAFIHLIPETASKGFTLASSIYLLSGIVAFFVVEKFIHWRHCHLGNNKEHKHPLVYMNLIGDGVHNFLDGMIIAGSYIVSIPLGITTTLAVIFHEIPQELGDFGVLVHGGLTKTKAVFFNFLSALTSFLGGIFAIILINKISQFSNFLVPFAAGGFIYIAGSDLIPELHKEPELKKSIGQLLALLFGILIMIVLLYAE